MEMNKILKTRKIFVVDKTTGDRINDTIEEIGINSVYTVMVGKIWLFDLER